MLDCTEVSNQGVYGSCSTFRSSLSSDYDPYIYRSKSPCRGLSGESDDLPVPVPGGPDFLQPPPGPCHKSGDQLSNCSSRGSLENREIPSTTSGAPLEGAAEHCVEHGACTCCFEVPLRNQEQKEQDIGDRRAGRCRQNFFASNSEQTGFDGLPCCFYTEMKVHRGSAGRYGEDFSVNVHYAPADSEGHCELAQRIPIIPEDAESGLVSEPRRNLFVPRVTEHQDRTSTEPNRGYFMTGACRTRDEDVNVAFSVQDEMKKRSAEGSGS